MIPLLIGAAALAGAAILLDKKEAKPAPETTPKKLYPIKRVCAWCKTGMGETKPSAPEPGLVSHGICVNCARTMKQEAAR